MKITNSELRSRWNLCFWFDSVILVSLSDLLTSGGMAAGRAEDHLLLDQGADREGEGAGNRPVGLRVVQGGGHPGASPAGFPPGRRREGMRRRRRHPPTVRRRPLSSSELRREDHRDD